MNNNFLPYQIKKTNDSNEALASQLAEKASLSDLVNIVQLVTDSTYGVKCDGTDESTKIQSVINHVQSLGGGRVHFPAKTYVCKNLTLPANVLLTFDTGAVLKFPVGAGGTDRMIIVGAISGASLPVDQSTVFYGIQGNGMIIDASNVASNQTINGVFVSGAQNFYIDGVTGNNFVAGYVLEVIQSYGTVVFPKNGVVKNIRCYNQRSWGGAVAVECGTNLVIENIYATVGYGVDLESDADVNSGITSFDNIIIRNVRADNGNGVNLNPKQCFGQNITVSNVRATGGYAVGLYYQTGTITGSLSNVSLYDIYGNGNGTIPNGIESPNDVFIPNLTVRNAYMTGYTNYGFKVNGGTWYDCTAISNGMSGWRSTLQSANSNAIAKFYNCTAMNNNTSGGANGAGWTYTFHARLEFYDCIGTDNQGTKTQWYAVFASNQPVITRNCMFDGNSQNKRLAPKANASTDVIDYETNMINTSGAITPYFTKTVTLSATQTTINHDLNRIPSFVQVIPSGNVTVWQSAVADNFNIYLTASGSVSCTVLIY